MDTSTPKSGVRGHFRGWWLVLVLAALGAVTLRYNAAPHATAWPWWAVVQALLLGPVVWLFCGGWSGRTAALGGGRGWLVGLAALQLLSAMLSAHPRESLTAALPVIALASFGVALSAWLLEDESRASRLATLVAAAGGVFALASLGWWFWRDALPEMRRVAALNAAAGQPLFSLDVHGFRNAQPLGHTNYTAGIAVLLLPWPVWAIRTARPGWARGCAWGAALLVFAMLVSSGSRGAILGLAGAAACMLALAARGAGWSRQRVLISATIAAVLVVGVALAVPRVRGSVVDLVRGGGPHVGDRQRLAMVAVGTAMGAERWWIGQGPGLTPRLYPRFRHEVEGGTPTILQLHATPLQVWADTGLPGLLLVLGLAGWIARRAWRAAGSRSTRTPLTLAAAASLGGYAAFALTDYQLDVSAVAALVAVNLAVLGAGAATPAPWLRRDWGSLIVAGGALVIAVVVLVPPARARALFSAAVRDLARGGDGESFNAAVIAATALEPDNPHYLAGGAAAHLRLGFATNDATRRTTHLAYAQAMLLQVVAIDPDSEFAHFNLGWLSLEHDPRSAADHFRRRIQLAPDRPGGYLGLGLAHLGVGDATRGVQAVALELVNDPSFLTSPAWQMPALAGHQEAVVRRALTIVEDFAAKPMAHETAACQRTLDLLRWWLGELPMIAEPDARESSGRAVLTAAAQQPEHRRDLLARHVFARRAQAPTADQLDVLEQLVAWHGRDWRAWLRAPEGQMAPLVSAQRPQRLAYAILARNFDLPTPVDAWVIPQNDLVAWFFPELFPAAGWVSDQRLLDAVRSAGL